jgi:hypothetical protein
MKSKAVLRAKTIVMALALALSTGALAQGPNRGEFRGIINDFTPASAPVSGPWEVRGPWSLVFKGRPDRAEFSAALTMERSDAGVTQSGGNDFNNPMDRMAHTHHITLLNGKVTPTATGFQVMGQATITKDGSFPPPFGPVLPVLTIEITGSTGPGSVRFSNITVLFGAPAALHFGIAPLHGVIRSWDYGYLTGR